MKSYLKFLKPMSLCAVAFTLSNCAAGSGEGDSYFVQPSPTGAISAGLINVNSGSIIDADGDGIAFQSGQNRDRTKNIAVSGIIGGENLPPVPTTGTGTYRANFEYHVIDKLTPSSTLASITGYRGVVSLSADFENGTLKGETSRLLSDSKITIDGTFANGNLSGTVTHDSLGSNGLQGELTGKIGSNKAIGAFHGHANGDQMAGGFVAPRQ